MAVTILGISAYYHDSAAAVIRDGVVIAAAQEERFTRKKHDSGFPLQAVRFCLEESGATLEKLDAVVFYDKPFLKFERLLETYYAYAPRGFRSFLTAMPVWIKEKIMLKGLLTRELKDVGLLDLKKTKLLFSEHHLSHAASAFYPSPFERAAILTMDGVGEWATTSISLGEGSRIRQLREMRFPHSLGLLYSAFTYYVGFKVNSGEYKLMGLAPYGNPAAEEVARFERAIREHMIDVREDGSLRLNLKYFNFPVGLTMTMDGEWEKLLGIPRRMPESELDQRYCNLALAIQRVTEDIAVKMARTAQKLTGAEYLCLAGGVALNCVANAKILAAGLFKDIWIQPAAGDAGGALGAALAAYHMYFEKPRLPMKDGDGMQNSLLGPEFSNLDVIRVAKKYGAQYEQYDDFTKLSQQVSARLAEGAVVGWVQGRMEWGPRALGNRSILGDPRNSDMQKRMNLKIKFRESFRPFAPAVLAEDASSYFNTAHESPYMLLVAELQKSRQKPLPEGFADLSLREKLYFVRSDIPAVTHLDYSARLQTVGKNSNPRFRQLLTACKDRTGCSVLVNTSFNVRGEPIVCTPEDAYRCFMRTDMDVLVVNDVVFEKNQQPAWEEPSDWKQELVLD